MARRAPRRPKPATEPAIVAQANPTPEQRARFAYVEDNVPNPLGAAVTVTTRKVDGETVTERVVHQHKACRRVPVYVALHRREVICDQTRAVLDWYDSRLALAHKGLTVDSLARANGLGSGSSHTTTDAAIEARSDVAWARSFIRDASALIVFDEVMEHERTFDEIALGNWRKARRLSTEFRLAASWLLLGIGHRVTQPS
jgi:hypothetical protein